MCGRFSIFEDVEKIKVRFHADLASGEVYSRPRYNAAPSQILPVIPNTDQKHIVGFKWGLHPKWLTKVTSKDGLINVRAETLRDKHTFSGDLANRRCLVLADGFYEWRKEDTGLKTPFRIVLKTGELFAFAGLWEKDEKGVNTFAIITTEPNELLQPIHNRMPVILSRKDEGHWLSADLAPVEAIGLLKPYPAKQMQSYEVSRLVNKAEIDEPDVIKKVGAATV